MPIMEKIEKKGKRVYNIGRTPFIMINGKIILIGESTRPITITLISKEIESKALGFTWNKQDFLEKIEIATETVVITSHPRTEEIVEKIKELAQLLEVDL